jgi:hypothetical protein
MEAAEKRIVESTRQISRLYHDGVNFNKAVESMRAQNISADLVKSIYDQLSTDTETLMTDRFHYYTMEGEQNFLPCDNIYYWTSRYLLAYWHRSPDSKLHKIKIFDLFNNRSM